MRRCRGLFSFFCARRYRELFFSISKFPANPLLLPSSLCLSHRRSPPPPCRHFLPEHGMKLKINSACDLSSIALLHPGTVNSAPSPPSSIQPRFAASVLTSALGSAVPVRSTFGGTGGLERSAAKGGRARLLLMLPRRQGIGSRRCRSSSPSR